MSSLNGKKRLSDARYLMKKIVMRAKELNKWKEECSQEEAIEIYNHCADVIQISEITLKKRKRRRNQLSWLTVCSLIR